MAMVPLKTTSQPMTAPPQDNVVLKASPISRPSRGLFTTWSANCAGAMYFCASRTMMRLGQDAADRLELAQGHDVEVSVDIHHARADDAGVGVDDGKQPRQVDFTFDALARHELRAVGVHADAEPGGCSWGCSSLKSWGLD